jgi:heavy metal sensor kinase
MMKHLKTLRAQIAVWTLLLLLAMLAAFGIFVYFNLQQGLLGQIDNSLSLSATQASALLNVDQGKILIPEPISLDESDPRAFGQQGLTLIVLARDGTVLQAVGPYSASLAPVNQISKNGIYLTLPPSNNRSALRAFILPVMDNNEVVGSVQTMQSLGEVQNTLDRLLAALLLGGGILAILVGVAAYFLATRALAPIDDITQTAQRISTQDLSRRLNLPNNGDEVSRLAATFDDMLARLEDGFNRERQFTADASHELRTPLTAMQTILSVTRSRRRSIEDYEQSLSDLTDETDRLQALTSSLLELAHRESHPNTMDETIDLSALLRDLTDSLRPVAEAKGLVIQCNVADGLILKGDTDGLLRMFANLLDNAILYTEHGEIRLNAGQESTGSMRVTIADTGSGIPIEHLRRIFDRFYRVDKSRSTRGAGLGLAIALEIAQAHGGKITVRSEVGKGTVFNVRLHRPADEWGRSDLEIPN